MGCFYGYNTQSSASPRPLDDPHVFLLNRFWPSGQRAPAGFEDRYLRAYIAALQSVREVQEIAQEVELDLEVGAIIRRCYETGSPAPFFQRIGGITPGFRILGAPAGASRQPGRRLARIALSLDMKPESTGREIVEKLAGGHGRTPVPPTIVPTAACFENTFVGDDVDITRLPAPMLHDGDGGRYLNSRAGHTICLRNAAA
jgi:UbiD family decarboxylase